MNSAPIYLIERRVWTAEAVSKGTYREVKSDSAANLLRHVTVKNSQCLKSMTAFRDLVETQVFSFTRFTHRDECERVCVCEGDKDIKLFQLPLKEIVLRFQKN